MNALLYDIKLLSSLLWLENGSGIERFMGKEISSDNVGLAGFFTLQVPVIKVF